jgi:hypothetical protein
VPITPLERFPQIAPIVTAVGVAVGAVSLVNTDDRPVLPSRTNIVYVQGIISSLNPPAVSGANVFVTTSAQTATYMFGLNASDGTILFQSGFSTQWEHYLAPTVYGALVYTDGGEYGGMYAFNTSSGNQAFAAFEQQYDEWTPAVDANYAYAYTGSFLTWVNNVNGTELQHHREDLRGQRQVA